MLDPFLFALAVLPLAAYLMVLGFLRISGRVLVTTGTRDLVTLMISIAGLLAIGPAELFFPKASASLLGPWVWIPIAMLYLLVVTLTAITSPARLVVYGRTQAELFPALLAASRRLDPDATGDDATFQVALPKHQIHLRIDGAGGMDCLSVLSFEPLLPNKFWRDLLKNLRREAKTTQSTTKGRGVGPLSCALILVVMAISFAASRPQELVEGFRDWLIR